MDEIAFDIIADTMVKCLHGIKLIESDFGLYIYDAHGNVTELLDNEYNVVQSYTYDPFGIENGAESSIRDTDMAEEMSIGGDMLMQSPDINDAIDDAAGLNSYADPNPYRYCGEYFDNETGYVYLRARYYAPTLSRFISENTAKDGYNWYVYCGNDPVNRVDPSGKFAITAAVIATIVIGAAIGATYGGLKAHGTGTNITVGAITGGIAGALCGMIACAAAVAEIPLVLAGIGAVAVGFDFDVLVQYMNHKLNTDEVSTNAEKKVFSIDYVSATSSGIFAGASVLSGAGLSMLFNASTQTEQLLVACTGGSIVSGIWSSFDLGIGVIIAEILHKGE